MIGTIGVGRRITIPKEIFNQYGIKEGMKVDITFENGAFIIKPCGVGGIYEKEKPKKTTKPKSKTNVNPGGFKRKIVSNLEEGQKFKTKYYSECGLVIRTKNRYLNEFCEECKGQLARESLSICKCKYLKPEEVNYTNKQKTPVKNEPNVNKQQNKSYIEEITSKVHTLSKQIDNQVATLRKPERRGRPKLKDKSQTVIQPVSYKNFKCCSECGEFENKGFLLDDKFYCTNCTKKDFKEFFINFKGGIK